MTPQRKIKTLFYRLQQQCHRCFYCSADLTCLSVDITVDHVMPRSLSGPMINYDRPENTVACCASCNHAKDDRKPTQDELTRLYELNKSFCEQTVEKHFADMLRIPRYLATFLDNQNISN